MSDPAADDALETKPSRGGAPRWRWPLILGGPLLVLLVAGYFVATGGRYQSTDDAYVQVAKAPVAPSIGGRVVEIYVHENQFVRRGQVLFKLDARDFQANAAAARAQLASAEMQVSGARAAYAQQQASVADAQTQVAFTAREAARQQELAAAGVASRQQVDQAANAAAQARDRLAMARQQAAQALAALGGDAQVATADHPAVMQARANLQRASLNVAYATVTAPADGIVARVDQMPLGTYLNTAQTAFWLLSGPPWIEANFKENQLAHMKVGQPVDIDIDASKGADIKGHVASFAPGAGSAFSALPAQNATGNWVKVTQRLPVRIAFDKAPPEMAARAGLSANVRVHLTAPGRAG